MLDSLEGRKEGQGSRVELPFAGALWVCSSHALLFLRKSWLAPIALVFSEVSPQQERVLAWLSFTPPPSIIPRGLTGAEARLKEVAVRHETDRWGRVERRRQACAYLDGEAG